MTKPVAGFNANPQNINKKGAPKREWTMRGLLKEALEEEDKNGIPYKKGISQKLAKLAKSGDIVAIKEVNNRIDGMPQASVDLTTKGEKLPTPIYASKSTEV